MLVEHPYGIRYLFTALSVAPVLFEQLLDGLTEAEADLRPDAERFTIREIVAHLAEWDDVFLGRMKAICAQEHPTLEGYDEGELAIEHNYAEKDWLQQTQLFRERRAHIVDFLRERSPQEWSRTALRPEIGVVTLEAQAVLIPLHDSYHLAQIVAWRRSSK
jgi:uncharacterized damage-inducible protein DinB